MVAESASKSPGGRLAVDLPDAGRAGRSGRLRGLVQLLDAGCKLKVPLGQTTLGVVGRAQVTFFQRMSL
jgi:hypothetical protein